jgi:Tat-targeted selenate reductase subunit YnfF
VEQLKKAPLLPQQAGEPAYSDMKFKTGSGKIELWSDTAVKLWGVAPLPSYVPPDDFNDAHLPFRLMTPCDASRIHSQFGNLGMIKNIKGQPAWEISVTDARRLGLKNGDSIRIYNSNEVVRGRVKITARVRSGSIVFPNGIWLNEGGGVNALITPAETDMGHGAAFHNTRVGVEKAS